MAEKVKPVLTPSAGRRYEKNIDQTLKDVLGIDDGERYARKGTDGRFSKRP